MKITGPFLLLSFLPTVLSFVTPKVVTSPRSVTRAISLPGYDEEDVEESNQLQDDEYAVEAPTKALAKGVSIRRKWGVDNDRPNEYWFDDRIHVLGNT